MDRSYKGLSEFLASALPSILIVIPNFLFALTRLCQEPTSRHRPCQDMRAVFECGTVLQETKAPDTSQIEVHRPKEPVIMGLLLFVVALWIKDFPITLLQGLFAGTLTASPIMCIAYFWPIRRSYKSISLEAARLLASFWSTSVAKYIYERDSPLKQVNLQSCRSMPLPLQIHCAILIGVGTYLMTRTLDGYYPMLGNLDRLGRLIVQSSQETDILVDRVRDVFEPVVLDGISLPKAHVADRSTRVKFIGYYGPKRHNLVLPGFLLVMVGTAHIWLWSERTRAAAETSRASVPAYLIGGAVALFMPLPKTETAVRGWVRSFGLYCIAFSVVFGQALQYVFGA